MKDAQMSLSKQPFDKKDPSPCPSIPPSPTINPIENSFSRFKVAAGLRRGVSVEDFLNFEPERKGTLAHWRWRIASLAESTVCRFLFISLVLINGVLIGVEADHPEGDFWDIVEYFFVIIFTFEIAMKLIGFGTVFWTEWWNTMDFLIVASSVVDIILKEASGNDSSGLSVLRLLRVLRVVRLVGFLEKLDLLARAFVEALKSVAWVMVLVLIIIYIFAVLGQGFFGEMVNDTSRGHPPCPNNNPDCIEAWFSTVTLSMLTLMQVMTLDSWGDMARIIGQQQPAAWVFFISFMLLTGLGMMNLLTAVFVEALLEQTAMHERKAKSTKDTKRKEALTLVAEAFTAFDEDGNGVLDAEELANVNKSLDTAEARKTFETLGLPADEIIRATTQAVEQDPDGVGVMGYHAMLDRIDKMHLPPEKEDIWEVDNRIKRVAEKNNFLSTEVQQLQMDVHNIQTDMQEILSLLEPRVT